MIIPLIFGLIFFLSIALNIFLLLENWEKNIENKEKEEQILSYLQQIDDLKSRAIKLAKSLEEQNSENKNLIEKMKETNKKNRIFRNYFFANNRKK